MPEPTPDPIRDSLRALADHAGAPMTPLPPSEVRRLGDRRRARRTAATAVASVAVIAAVATPIALLSGQGEPDQPPTTSGPTSTGRTDPAPPDGWVTTIPGDFPIIQGYPAEDEERDPTVATPGRGGVDEPEVCGNPVPLYDGLAERLGGRYEGPEDFRARSLITFPDARTARAVLENAGEVVGSCQKEKPEEGSNTTVFYDLHDVPAGDESLVFTQRYYVDEVGGWAPGLGVTAIILVGNALLVTTEHNEGGGSDSAIANAAQHLAGKGSDDLVARMCVYALEPCGDGSTESSTPSSTPSGSGSATIPADFSIGLGSPDLGGTGQVNTSPAGERMVHAQPCGSEGVPGRTPVDLLDYELTGEEFTEWRELRTYPDAAAAQAGLDVLAEAAAGCGSETLGNGLDVTWQVHMAQTGYSSVTLSRLVGTEGGFTWQYTRVGQAVFTVAWVGEGGSEASIRSTVDSLTAITKQVAPQMCPFTADGC